MILSVFVLSCYVLPGAYANSEFYVSNTKGSYNLGCELDNSCFEPYITSVGLYNKSQELVAVGKLSFPLPVSQFTDTTVIVNFDI